MSETNIVPAEETKNKGLVISFAEKYGVDPEKLMNTLKKTCFKNAQSNEQLMALLVVADQYNLNPFTKEIYAFPDRGGIVPVVGVDGWSRIINQHPNFAGIDFNHSEETTDFHGKPVPVWTECVIHRSDRDIPTRVREYFGEVSRNTEPWKSHPSRMLRHKALIQAARVAFGFTGIKDPDEAERIKDITPKQEAQTNSLEQHLKQKNKAEIIEVDNNEDLPEYSEVEVVEEAQG